MNKPNFEIEKKLWNDHKFIVGIDETGTGSAIGSLCVAGIVFPTNMSENELPKDLKDSKKLSAKKREKIFDEIMKKALFVKVVFGSCEEIDETNVLKTNLRCMTSIIESLNPDFILIDGIHSPGICNAENSKTIIRGDNLSSTIAAASIVAKVSRDRYVKKLVIENPELEKYGIGNNMGYLSSQHRNALDIHGRTKLHRQSYKYKWNKVHS